MAEFINRLSKPPLCGETTLIVGGCDGSVLIFTRHSASSFAKSLYQNCKLEIHNQIITTTLLFHTRSPPLITKKFGVLYKPNTPTSLLLKTALHIKFPSVTPYHHPLRHRPESRLLLQSLHRCRSHHPQPSLPNRQSLHQSLTDMKYPQSHKAPHRRNHH